MAWQTIASTNLYSSGTLVGYVYFEYDTSSTGSSRSCRVRIGERGGGYYFSVDFRDFTVNGNNLGTIAVTQTSGTIWNGSLPSGNRSVTWYCPWYSGTVNYNLSGDVPSAGTPPSGGHIEFVSHTWNSVTVTSSVSSWGSNYSGTPKLEGIFIDPVATPSNWNHTGRVVLRTYTNATTMTFSDISNTNYSGAYNGGYTLKGMTPYKISCFASTDLGETTDFDDTVRYTPPAPGQLSYTDEGNGSWRIVYTGVAANNSTSYTAADLVRTFRYKDSSSSTWTYVQQDAQAALTDATISVIPISPQHTVEIEAWMTYKGEQSEVSSTTITNAAPAVHLYGSANNQAEEIEHLYGSVNGQTEKITKLYASVGGVTKLIFEDNS